MAVKITRGKLLAAMVALVMAAIWPARIAGLPFILIGLVLIWFPDNRHVSLWISRGLPTSDSPPFAVSIMGWIFITVMPVLLGYLMLD